MYYGGTSDNNIQADHHHHHANNNIQTLYLMNPNNSYMQGYTTTTDTQQQQQQQHQQLLFLNSSPTGNNALNHVNISHAPPQHQQHFVGVPLPAVSLHDQINHHGFIQRLWNNQSGSHHHHESHQVIPSSTVVSATSCGGTTTDLASQLGFQRPVVVSPSPQHREQQGGLSLSLSPQQQQQISFNNISSSSSLRTNNNVFTIRGTLDGSSSNMVFGSKYLKATQELLDEVVNIVGKSINKGDDQKKELENSMNKESMPLASDVNTSSGGGGERSSKQKIEVAADLTTSQRQELQMKKAKLVTMLEEVEQRYRQYHHQMQIIVSSFEQVAGIGSAKSYTQLALHAISKQFRCLKDAIAEQIKATSKSLGEEEGLGRRIVEGSRLKFVDHHLRQQRALQQLGMMQPNAWRPQRGLPERAVSVLRAWLFEHFLHPYPKDSDKIMLAKQTGLTRSQVSNWFINARVRLWKPMVEEMYLEEVKNQEQNSTSSHDNKNKDTNMVSNSSAMHEEKQPIITSSLLQGGTTPTKISTSTISTSPTAGASIQGAHQAPNFSFLGSFNMENTSTTAADHIENNAKKPRNGMQKYSPSSILSSVDMEAKARESSNKGFNNPLMAAYAMGDFGRFDPHEQMTANFHGNGVSLTLGLPPSENLAMPVSQQNYLSNQNIDMGSRPEMGSHYNRMGYENIDFQSGNKRFPTQLLPDFVTGNLGT